MLYSQFFDKTIKQGEENKSPERGRKMLQIVDGFISNKIEKFAHWWQKITGKDCFWLAKAAAVCYGLFGTAIMANIMLKGKEAAVTAICSIVAFLCMALAAGFIKQIKFKQEIVSIAHSRGLANPFKIIDYGVRISAVFLSPICSLSEVLSLLQGRLSFLLIFTGIFGNIFLWILLLYYFSACDPLPPAKSKVRQWLEKVVSAAKEALSPTPQPQPIPVESRFL